jgi:spermidine synthase
MHPPYETTADQSPVTVERRDGPYGEVVLRRRGGHGRTPAVHEIIANGCFLMDTSDGRSERLLVRAALDALPADRRAPTLLLGGLGVGFSLAEAAGEPRWGRITVVERETAVIDWHHDGPLSPISADALADPRTAVVHADLVAYLRAAPDGQTPPAAPDPQAAPPAAPATPARHTAPRADRPNPHPDHPDHPGDNPANHRPDHPLGDPARRADPGGPYDALCLDIDNGPGWTVTEDNGGLYSPAGLAACRARLTPGGVLAVWSAQPSPAFEEHLRNAGFARVWTEEMAVVRGVPDVVHLAISDA